MTDGAFYVYVLFDWFGIPRYVGKGKNDRWLDHERRSDPLNEEKNVFIEQTWIMLNEIPKVKTHENLDEATALTVESVLICAIGRLDLGTGPLVNKSNGGNGGDLGIYIKRSKARWTPQKRAIVSANISNANRAFWARLSEEERGRRKIEARRRYVTAIRNARASDPEWEVRRRQRISEGHQRRTIEEKEASRLKRLQKTTHDERSAAARRGHAKRTPEERSAAAQARSTKKPAEQRRAEARKREEGFTAHQRESRARQLLIARQNSKRQSGSDTRWITDGRTNQRLASSEELPSGWRFGRTIRT